jgi:hypothetical protein
MIETRTAPYAALVLRVSLGLMFVVHALLKLFVFTLPGTAQFFQSIGLPGFLGYAVFAAELVGGVLLIAGVGSRWAAAALVPVLLCAPPPARNCRPPERAQAATGEPRPVVGQGGAPQAPDSFDLPASTGHRSLVAAHGKRCFPPSSSRTARRCTPSRPAAPAWRGRRWAVICRARAPC